MLISLQLPETCWVDELGTEYVCATPPQHVYHIYQDDGKDSTPSTHMGQCQTVLRAYLVSWPGWELWWYSPPGLSWMGSGPSTPQCLLWHLPWWDGLLGSCFGPCCLMSNCSQYRGDIPFWITVSCVCTALGCQQLSNPCEFLPGHLHWQSQHCWYVWHPMSLAYW